MSENKVNNLLGVSMDKIKEMVDVNTVIGDPITAPLPPAKRPFSGCALEGRSEPPPAKP